MLSKFMLLLAWFAYLWDFGRIETLLKCLLFKIYDLRFASDARLEPEFLRVFLFEIWPEFFYASSFKSGSVGYGGSSIDLFVSVVVKVGFEGSRPDRSVSVVKAGLVSCFQKVD